jgi:hypothetical protein
LPTTADPPTGKQFIELAAKAFGTQPRYRILTRPMVWLGGLLDPTVRELYEMLYQYEFDYIFDSTKFTNAFNFRSTPYPDGVNQTEKVRMQCRSTLFG